MTFCKRVYSKNECACAGESFLKDSDCLTLFKSHWFVMITKGLIYEMPVCFETSMELLSHFRLF